MMDGREERVRSSFKFDRDLIFMSSHRPCAWLTFFSSYLLDSLSHSSDRAGFDEIEPVRERDVGGKINIENFYYWFHTYNRITVRAKCWWKTINWSFTSIFIYLYLVQASRMARKMKSILFSLVCRFCEMEKFSIFLSVRAPTAAAAAIRSTFD